jgi:3-isopropylmalate/(R)-2-methylmalate dehydratase small subunit
MEPITVIRSRICPMDADDVDTDQILPKQYLKRIERSGFGPFAFADWRYEPDGTPKPDFPMNHPAHVGAEIMVAGRNFGCGSSREHAPWALEDAGVRAIVAPSFGDIFRTNCGKIGVLCVALDVGLVRQLFSLAEADPATQVTVDLVEQRVVAPAVGGIDGIDNLFDIDQHTKHCLLNGLDDIALTVEHDDEIAAYERGRPRWKPLVPSA